MNDEVWQTGEPYQHDKYGWACLTWRRYDKGGHGKTFLAFGDIAMTARMAAQANTDYLNELEKKIASNA